MKRIYLLTIFFICIVSLISGCSKVQTEPPNENFLGMIMVDGDLWVYTGDEVSIEIDKSAIIGKISSTVKYFETPTENGQANFEIKGSKYAQYQDNIVVLIDGKWILFINNENWNYALSIHYDEYLKKDIFGDLSEEEIYKILRAISEDIRKDKDYENNLELIIENVFREFGIDDASKLNYAKSSIKITITDEY